MTVARFIGPLGQSRPWVLLGIVAVTVVVAAIGVSDPGDARRQQERADSDAFWARLGVQGIRAESFTSLQEMLTAADAVVVGTVVDVQPGRVVRSEDHPDDALAAVYNANMVVEVKDRLSGNVQPGSRLVVEFLLGIGRPYTPDLAQGVPKEPSVFVLRDKVVFQKRMGQSEEDIKAAEGLYWIITDEAVFRDMGGEVRVLPNAVSAYIRAQDGRSFDEFVAELRTLLRS